MNTQRQKQQVQIKVFEQEQHDGEWPPTKAVDCIAWFQAKVSEIPEEYRATATIEIDSAGGYEGSHFGKITISYWRIETDEEVEARYQILDSYRANRERQLVAELERLRSGK